MTEVRTGGIAFVELCVEVICFSLDGMVGSSDRLLDTAGLEITFCV